MKPLAYALFFKSLLEAVTVQNNIRRNAKMRQIIRRRHRMWRQIYLHMKRVRQGITGMCNQILFSTNIIEAFLTVESHRSIWMKPRSYHFWDEIVQNSFDEAEWIESFRMRKEIFQNLCGLLQPDLEPKPLLLKSREPLSVLKQVAVALYKLARCAEYRVVGNVLGIHKSTVRKCLYRVVNAINRIMMPEYLRMPNEHEASEIATNFEKISHIPQIIGCIDGSHIPILAPTDGYRDYVNRKGWPSYNLQAVVDDKCRFRNICIRYPGNTHDAALFKDSSLYKNVQEIIPQGTRNVHGLKVPYMVVGDPAYPLLPWLLKGYPGTVTAEQESFNVYLSSARVAVEMAFGRLRGRWRILLKRIDVYYKFVPNITSACCILQNFLGYNNEQFIPRWLEDVNEAEIIFPQPNHLNNRERDSIPGSEILQQLADYLSNNFPLRRSVLR